MSEEKAPAGQGEGADQNAYQGEPIVTTVLPDTAAVHLALRAWGAAYAAALEEAFEEIEDDAELREAVARVRVASLCPPLPRTVFPAWAATVEIDVTGGEASLEFKSEPHGGHGLTAYLCAFVHVVVLPGVGTPEAGMAEVGDHDLGEGITVGWDGLEPWDESSWEDVLRLSHALGSAALQLAAVEAGR